MIKFDFNAECCGCSACAQICPKNCISMQENYEGFLVPVISASECIDCGLCEKACPVLNAKPESLSDINTPEEVYAAYNENDETRLGSSSGGIFMLLAEYTLRNGGIVFGAVLSEDCKSVYHCSSDNIEDMRKFSGSKYVQSNIKEAYKRVKAHLEAERLVLFSGTPCQIEGLLHYLSKKYNNLICMDFICHGVPSLKVYRKYIEYIEKKSIKISDIQFRDKTNGWRNFSLCVNYVNGESLSEPFDKNIYGSAFLSDLCLRRSCYRCKFRKANHSSDITVGDFWGIEQEAPELYDNKGVSVIVINTQKGREIFEDIKSELTYKRVDFFSAEKHNAILKQPIIHKNRQRFFKNLDSMDFKKNVRRNINRHCWFVAAFCRIVKSLLKSILGEKRFRKMAELVKK